MTDPKRNWMRVIMLSTIFSFFLFRWYYPVYQNTRMEHLVGPGSNALTNKQPAEAIKQFDLSLRKHPADPALFVSIINVCQLKNEWKLAADYANRAIAECAKSPNEVRSALYQMLASSLLQTETARPQKQTLAAYDRALQLNPDDAMALNSLGYTLVENDTELERAENCLNRAYLLVREQANGDPQSQQSLAMVEDSCGWLLVKKKRLLRKPPLVVCKCYYSLIKQK